MVCVYCSSATQVTNSRHQRRSNNIWRRRKCLSCGAVFTTNENAELETSFVLKKTKDSALTPFSRDQLMISIYESCRHRADAAADAAALTRTIISKIIPLAAGGTITQASLIKVTTDVLKHFDDAAATIYTAYHPLPKDR